MPPRTSAGADGDGNDEPTLLGIVEMNKLFKDVIILTPQSGVHDPRRGAVAPARLPARCGVHVLIPRPGFAVPAPPFRPRRGSRGARIRLGYP